MPKADVSSTLKLLSDLNSTQNVHNSKLQTRTRKNSPFWSPTEENEAACSGDISDITSQTNRQTSVVIPRQLKYVFRLDKNVSHAMAPQGNNNLNFLLAPFNLALKMGRPCSATPSSITVAKIIMSFQQNMLYLVKLNPDLSSLLLEEAKAAFFILSLLFLLTAKTDYRFVSTGQQVDFDCR